MLQRIERWAAYARGYNRLRSVRLSPGRMTMQEEPESRWSISQATNRLVVENNWSPSFRQRRQTRTSAPEQTRLNCCALSNLNYKSNANLDSNCLEAYSLDHSIYFKTIGEIRSELRSKTENGNNTTEQQPRTTPLDCGDFLSSDFDDDEELAADLDDVDFDLREQLDQLELGCNVYTSSGDELQDDDSEEQLQASANSSGVIQLCRSQLNEDEINNNIMMMGFQRKLVAAQ